MMNTTIDLRIYSDSVISKAVYWLSGDYIIIRKRLDDSTESITATPKMGFEQELKWMERFMCALNDFKLREVVAKETHEIKTILYAKAFSEDDSLTEEDIHD